MTYRDVTFPSTTKECTIFARIWEPDTAPRAVVQVAHGMAEHILRYEGLAEFLTSNGIALAANDHAGHGRSAASGGTKGYFSAKGGWLQVVEDMHTLHDLLAADYPNVPLVLLGHSMGSFLARTYASSYIGDFSAYIFSGTAGANPALGAAKLIAAAQGGKASRKESPLLNSLSFGAYNKPFKPNRTEFDWLTRDEAIVDAYVADPDCGFCFTVGGFSDLFDGLTMIQSAEWAKAVDDKPILVMSGASDPVGGMGKGVKQVADMLTAAGKNAQLKLYPYGRHEMFNELNKEEVYSDVLAFIESAI